MCKTPMSAVFCTQTGRRLTHGTDPPVQSDSRVMIGAAGMQGMQRRSPGVCSHAVDRERVGHLTGYLIFSESCATMEGPLLKRSDWLNRYNLRHVRLMVDDDRKSRKPQRMDPSASQTAAVSVALGVCT